MYTYTFIFSTHDGDLSTPVNGVFEIPMKGFSSEDEAYEAFTKLPMHETIDGEDYFQGHMIGIAIETVTIRD
jgi:hypothetical protein